MSEGSRSPSPTRKATRKKEWREEAWRKGRVTVEVLGARNLPADEDVADPFVALRLVDVAERNPLPFPFDRCVKTSVNLERLKLRRINQSLLLPVRKLD